MQTMMLRAVALAASVFLVGCATTADQCDVHQKDASLLNKLGCRNHDANAVTTAAKELEDARALNQAFRQALTDLEAEQAAVGQSLAVQQAAHKKSQASLRAILGKVKASKGQRADTLQQVAAVEKQLQAMENKPAAASGKELAQRTKERDALLRKVRELELSLGY